jgi:hypothetical protein
MKLICQRIFLYLLFFLITVLLPFAALFLVAPLSIAFGYEHPQHFVSAIIGHTEILYQFGKGVLDLTYPWGLVFVALLMPLPYMAWVVRHSNVTTHFAYSGMGMFGILLLHTVFWFYLFADVLSD